MKLSNLSLAVLSAIALAACGSSGNDNQTTDPGAGAGSTPPKQITPPKDEKKDDEKKDDQQNAAAKDKEIVNPTQDKVVDNINLGETSTTASQQYIRGAKSNYDNKANPSHAASTTVLSGISLDKQNPQLTNIVIARPQGTNKDGDIVQIAQYAGASTNKFTDPQTLQNANENNVWISNNDDSLNTIGYRYLELDGNDASGTNVVLNKRIKGYRIPRVAAGITTPGVVMAENPSISNIQAEPIPNLSFSGSVPVVEYSVLYNVFLEKYVDYMNAYNKFNAEPIPANKTALINAVKDLAAMGSGNKVFNTAAKSSKYGNISAVGGTRPLNMMLAIRYPEFFRKNKIKPVRINVPLVKNTNLIKTAALTDSDINMVTVEIPDPSELAAFGAGKFVFTYNGVRFSQPFVSDLVFGDTVDANDKIVGSDGNNPSIGLVGIWKQGSKNEYLARGTDDNNVRNTRIFGHYYQTPDSLLDGKYREGYNSWNGAETIITGFDVKGNANQYGLAANPIRLDNVQYGRVTAKIAEVNFDKENKTYGWKYEKQDLADRDPKHKDDSVDFYFYRGTDATSIKDMASLPTDAEVLYKGHALMYGIDNNFHGAGEVLPNAFGVEESYGLGNFVEAHLDMGKKKLSGMIYNAWHSPESDTVVKDSLVKFEGDVVGNTAHGTSELAYDASAPKGVFKGSFFGPKAKELGGSVNSVTDKEVYGDLKWGGVFGAQRVGGGTGSAWLVSSQKK